MLQGEPGLIGPLLYQGYHKDNCKDGQDCHRDSGTGQPPANIPQRVLPQIRIGDAVIADVEPFQKLEDTNAADGGDEHDHGDHCSPVEIRNTSQHLVIEQGSNNLIPSSHRGRDTKVGKAQEKGLDKGSGQSAQQWTQHRDPERSQGLVPHHLGNGERFLVYKTHGIVDKQEGHRDGIDHIAHHQASEAVDVKQLPP